MILNKILDSSEVLNLATLPETGGGRALIKAVEKELELKREEYEDHPRIDDADIRRDLRFQAGAIWAFKKVLGLSRDAQAIISQTEKQTPLR
jgi:hypothetical protein